MQLNFNIPKTHTDGLSDSDDIKCLYSLFVVNTNMYGITSNEGRPWEE
jgi:hypothetical protein